MRPVVRLLSFCSLFLVAAAVVPAFAGTAELGELDFPNSGAPEAQEAFKQGMLLLHSFEYEDAREAFEEAQQQDPDFVLATWGEAMTFNHPLWREQDVDAARAALARLAPSAEERAAKAGTDRERGFLEAVELLFGDGDKLDRDLAYSEALGALSARYPDDLEAKSFYALSILGTAQGIRDFSVYMRAGAVAEEVFAVNPRHPGAAHYLIHSYDDPVHAPLGLRAARVYADIAPAASHAQHMISHIYVALGHWGESVDANVKSFDVSVERWRRKDLGIDALNYHSLHWLEYSYLQLGRYKDAWQKLQMMDRYARESGSPRALWYHAAMRAAWIVETGGREAPAAIKPDETQVTGAAADLFASGYMALRAGDREAAEAAAAAMGERHDSAAAGHLCGQRAGFEETSRQDLIVAQVMQNSLRGLIALHAGDTDAAVKLLEQATVAEGELPLEFGPPIIVKPSHELYGEVLLDLGRPEEARSMFEQALARAPRRALSLAGVARAAHVLGDGEAVLDACGELASVYAGADPTVQVPEPCRTGSSVERAGLD
jgi:tetratricopeptide (TPR) repeat protein